MELTKAAADVLAERRRQVESEGWTSEHDDQHDDRSMAIAGACYATQYVGRAWLLEAYPDGGERYQRDAMPHEWPVSWAEEWWKPKTPRRDLVRAAALLLAEIERLDRMTPNDRVEGPGAASSRTVPSHDRLGTAVPPAPTFGERNDD